LGFKAERFWLNSSINGRYFTSPRKEGNVGAVAFSGSGDFATGDFSDAKVIRKFGDVPDDLSVS
jgi:hypothetical protein